MNDFIEKIVLLCIMVTISAPAFSQVTARQRRERKKMVRECSKSRNPYIRLDQSKTLSVDEFLNFSDSIYSISKVKGTDTIMSHQNKRIVVDGALLVTTQQYHDAMKLRSRQWSIQNFRRNEMRIFFGQEDPLILMGDREITREEYVELPEDTVAFVNFYMTDFVKRHHAPKGSRGIVYVCPRNKRSQIKYTTDLDMPANGRNYINDFYKRFIPCLIDENGYAHFPSLYEKVKEYKERIGLDIKGMVTISCVVRPNGTIDPILVEDIEAQQQLTDEQEDTLIKASEEIIRTLPRWEEPGAGYIYDQHSTSWVGDVREFSISVPIRF